MITDSIEAKAARATGETEEIAVRSIRAGNDIVLTTGQGSWIRTYRALLAEARKSRAFRALVRASAHRVLTLQNGLVRLVESGPGAIDPDARSLTPASAHAARSSALISNTRGSTFSMCERGLRGEPGYAKYPRLPVLRCAGLQIRR